MGFPFRGGGSSYVLARPKSAILRMPWLLINKLAAFISRCRIFIYLSDRSVGEGGLHGDMRCLGGVVSCKI